MAEISTIFGVVLVVLLIMAVYWLYKYAIRSNLPMEKISLAAATAVPDETASSVCYYSFWIYVNSWSREIKPIITKGTNPAAPICKLYLNALTPEMVCETNTGTGTAGTQGAIQKTVLQRSFPLQAWTYVVLAFDGNVMDYYINGKMVTSAPLDTVIPMDDASDLKLGGDGADIHMSGFIKRADRATASKVADEYESSKTIMQKTVPNYKLDMTLLKDGEIAKKISLI